MSSYSENYCLDHDIDYFSIINGKKSHIASNGSVVPSLIDERANSHAQRHIYRRIRHNRYIKQRWEQKGSYNIFELDNVEIKVDSIKRILFNEGYGVEEITEDVMKDYAASFVEFAELGLDSYDTIDGRLILIAGSKRESDEEINDLQLPISENEGDFKLGFSEDYLPLPKLK